MFKLSNLRQKTSRRKTKHLGHNVHYHGESYSEIFSTHYEYPFILFACNVYCLGHNNSFLVFPYCAGPPGRITLGGCSPCLLNPLRD